MSDANNSAVAKKPEPYLFFKGAGVVPMREVRRLAGYLLPLVGLKWEAEGVDNYADREGQDAGKLQNVEVYQFRRSRGLARIGDLMHFEAWLTLKLERMTPPPRRTEPLMWRKKTGLAKAEDLKGMAKHFFIRLGLDNTPPA